MPVALLLQEVLGQILDKKRGIHRLTPFGQLALIDEILMERARSAFMVHWFGASLPYEHLGLRIHIDNIDPLRARYQQIAAQMKADEEAAQGLNFTEPLAGLVGAAAGALFSPAGTIYIIAAQLQRIDKVSRSIIWIIWGPIIYMLGAWVAVFFGGVALLAFPAAVAGAIWMGHMNQPPIVRAIYDFLGVLARASGPFIDLMKQLLGPRSGVKNPLLRHILDVADRLAGAFALALGFIAVIVTRIIPALIPLAFQVGPLRQVLSDALEIATQVFVAFKDQLADFFGEKSAFDRLVKVFKFVIPKLAMKPLETLDKMFTTVGEIFTKWKEEAKKKVDTFKDTWKPAFKAMLDVHPLVRAIKAMMMLKDLNLPPAPPPKPKTTPKKGFFDRRIDDLLDIWRKPIIALWDAGPGAKLDEWDFLGGPTPNFTLFPDVDKLAKRAWEPVYKIWDLDVWPTYLPEMPKLKPGEKREVAEWAKKAVDRAARRPRLFKPPELDLGELHKTDMMLREHIITVIERVMPPMVRKHVPTLLDVFKMLDEEIYATDAEKAAAAKKKKKEKDKKPNFPTLDLDETKELMPVVRKIRVRVKGGYEPELQSFREKLNAALRDRTYVVP